MEISSMKLVLTTICVIVMTKVILSKLRECSAPPQPDAPAGRIRQFTDTFLATNLDEDMRNRTRDQEISDKANFEFTPSLFYNTQNWPFGEFILDAPLYTGAESVLFSIHHAEDLLVKYQADCTEIHLDWVHPLMQDFWYGRLAFEAGVGPEPLFLSPPVPFQTDTDKLRHIKLSREEQEICVRQRGAVRFMISVRLVGAKNLNRYIPEFPKAVLPFDRAMKLGVELIRKIHDLHEIARVIHGDVHPGNIMVEDDRVWLIDYGRSRSNQPARSNRPIYPRYQWHHQALTHWQIRGYEWAARDDVYNAVRTIAWVMNDNKYSEYEKKLHDSFDLIQWRETEFIFSVPNGSDPIEALSIPEENKKRIQRSLERVLDSVRALDDVDDVPDYEFIIYEFQACFRLANGLSPL